MPDEEGIAAALEITLWPRRSVCRSVLIPSIEPTKAPSLRSSTATPRKAPSVSARREGYPSNLATQAFLHGLLQPEEDVRGVEELDGGGAGNRFVTALTKGNNLLTGQTFRTVGPSMAPPETAMGADAIRFEDAAAYEHYMGHWSQLVGAKFLEWLNPARGLRWIDVGCGNGAFTEMLVARCSPSAVTGVDPSEAQVRYAQGRAGTATARFQQGDAISLPMDDASADVAAMALVIFFVPEPARAVAEMVRVLKPGGMACAYAWDMLNGGFPYAPLLDGMLDAGMIPTLPPSAGASRIETLRQLWGDAGLMQVQVLEITVQRSFADFEDYWQTSLKSPTLASRLKAMTPAQVQTLKAAMRARVQHAADTPLVMSACANAVKGTVSGNGRRGR